MPVSLRLFAFDGGVIYTTGVRFLNAQAVEETRDMSDPNHSFLIQHPDGLLMWDTGLPDRIAFLPDQTLERGEFRFNLASTLKDQMLAAGFQPETVDLLGFSHLQIDHAGNTSQFHNATILVQNAEYEMAFRADADTWGYIPTDFSSILDQKIEKINGDMDVFRDGKVILLSAPGHTPGHQVLYIDLPHTGPLLLSGDLYYDPKDPIENWMPAWNYDHTQTHNTMIRLNEFAAQHGARWIINHSKTLRDQIPLAPGWME